MHIHSPSSICPPALRRSLLALAIGAAAAHTAGAQTLTANSFANDSFYNYNTVQGVVAAGGSSSGSTGTGGGDATSLSTSAGGQGNFAYTSQAYANANYATGTLHASALTDGAFGDAAAFASIDDTVTFHIAGASASTVTLIGIDLSLDGSVSDFQNVSYLYNFKIFSSGSAASVGWQTVLYDSPNDPRNYVGYAVSGGAGAPDGFQSFSVLADNATEKVFHGVLAVTGADTTYGLTTGLNLRCGGGTDCDFAHSAHLNFSLPDSVSFTSGSGLLLTDVGVTPVPEPETYALMLAGFGVMGWMARRRRA